VPQLPCSLDQQVTALTEAFDTEHENAPKKPEANRKLMTAVLGEVMSVGQEDRSSAGHQEHVQSSARARQKDAQGPIASNARMPGRCCRFPDAETMRQSRDVAARPAYNGRLA
jgi:hypothetical protein